MSKIVDLANAERVGKAYLIDSLILHQRFNHEDAERAVNGALEAIATALRSGTNVSLSNIGTLRRETATARTHRNPQTGERFAVGDQEVVRWTSSPTLLDVINGRTIRESLAVKAPKGSLK
jgi:DNA-binding protein HU-beta